MGRPSVDPELMIRRLIVGYCMGIRSERRLCDEVHLAYRWFCSPDRQGVGPVALSFAAVAPTSAKPSTCPPSSRLASIQT
jgi:hypothetical protein